jgi:hypothetical protein
MKTIFLFFIFSITAAKSFAQKEIFELVKYMAPKGWKKELRQDLVMYTIVAKKDKAWCQLGIYKSTDSRGSLEKDFAADWKELVCNTYKIADTAMAADTAEADGWKIKTGSGNFTFNNKPAAAMLTTFSGYGKSISIVAVAGNQRYLQDIENLIASIELTKPASGNLVESNQTLAVAQNGFAFSTTNFDDGWVSTIQPDWVEISKGNIKILLHYQKQGTIFPADPEPLTKAAWDILIAPRYPSVSNFKTASPNDYKRVYWASANASDKNGNSVYVVLFRQGGGWMEFIAPDKHTFIQQFGADDNSIRWDTDVKIFEPMTKMANYNKFAVAAPDLYGTGKWSDRFASNTFYANYYTGAFEGMSSYSSSQWFEFGSGQNYNWKLIAANSYGGVTNVAQGKGNGTFKSVTDWQLYFTDIEGKPKTFDVYFTAVKGGRILWMNDAEYPGSGIFTGYTQR